MKTLQQKIIEADEKGGRLLYRANVASDRGQYDKAEELYEKGQKWLDISNNLRGNG